MLFSYYEFGERRATAIFGSLVPPRLNGRAQLRRVTLIVARVLSFYYLQESATCCSPTTRVVGLNGAMCECRIEVP